MNELEKVVYGLTPAALNLPKVESIKQFIEDMVADTIEDAVDETQVNNLLNEILSALEHKSTVGLDSTLDTLDSVRFDSVQSTPDLVDATDPSSAITIDPEYFDQVKKDLGIRNPMYRIDQVEYIKNTNEVLVQLKKADGTVNELKKTVNSGIVQNWGI